MVDAYRQVRQQWRRRRRLGARGPEPDERLRPAIVKAVTDCLDLDVAIDEWFESLQSSLRDLAAQAAGGDDAPLRLVYTAADVALWRQQRRHQQPSASMSRRLMLRDDITRGAWGARAARPTRKKWISRQQHCTAAEARHALDKLYVLTLGSLAG